jgi:uncharacterized membrane protein YccC
MQPLKDKLRQMAENPRSQLKQLIIGTLGAFFCMLLLIYTSEQENAVLFYFLSTLLMFCVLYAIPGYLGIWMWRMRKVFFDID